MTADETLDPLNRAVKARRVASPVTPVADARRLQPRLWRGIEKDGNPRLDQVRPHLSLLPEKTIGRHRATIHAWSSKSFRRNASGTEQVSRNGLWFHV